jgi:hypothetical protein
MGMKSAQLFLLERSGADPTRIQMTTGDYTHRFPATNKLANLIEIR